MSTRRIPTVCPPCGKPGTLHGPAVALKFVPKRPTPLNTGVALNEVAWKDDKGEEVDCTICAYPMSADSAANPWTGPGLFLTQACVNGHVYHKGCLLTHMSRSNNFNSATCPECRNPILSEVAASLRRNGAPAPVPAPAPTQGGGGGLFGGGGGGDGEWVDDWLRAREPPLARMDEEEMRLDNEARRAAQLPYQSLEPLPPMTGINGRFWLVGRANDNPTPLEIQEALRARASNGPLYADALFVTTTEQNLNPFHNPPHGMVVTLVTFEFNGLTDEEGGGFLQYARDNGVVFNGVPSDNTALATFYHEFFDLPTTPRAVYTQDGPNWGERRTSTLRITPEEYDAWAGVAQEERAARAAVPAEERERLDDF